MKKLSFVLIHTTWWQLRVINSVRIIVLPFTNCLLKSDKSEPFLLSKQWFVFSMQKVLIIIGKEEYSRRIVTEGHIQEEYLVV